MLHGWQVRFEQDLLVSSSELLASQTPVTGCTVGRNKNPMPQESGENTLTDSTLFAILAGATLSVGLFFGVIYTYTVRGIAAAENWETVSCVIEASEFVVHDDDDGVMRVLNFVYRYTYEGREYRSDRLDMVPGTMGDDGPWEKAIYDDHPVGTEAVCYVDPNNPVQAVFDRQHGSTSTRTIWMLAFPFLCMGIGFSLACAKKVVSNRLQSVSPPSEFPVEASVPPRHVSPVSTLLILGASPRGSGGVCALLVGFAFVFVAFRGPEALQDAWEIGQRDQTASGLVTKVEKLSFREWGIPLYEYEFSFQVGDRNHRGNSATPGKVYSLDDPVEIAYNPQQLEHAIIVGARPSGFPRWIGVGALVIVGALVLFYLQVFATNWLAWRLLRNGRIAVSQQPGEEENSQGIHGPYFEVDGNLHQIRSAPLNPTAQVKVLYDPKSPRRNLILNGLEHHLQPSNSILPFVDGFIDLSIVPLSLLAICLLL